MKKIIFLMPGINKINRSKMANKLFICLKIEMDCTEIELLIPTQTGYKCYFLLDKSSIKYNCWWVYVFALDRYCDSSELLINVKGQNKIPIEKYYFSDDDNIIKKIDSVIGAYGNKRSTKNKLLIEWRRKIQKDILNKIKVLYGSYKKSEIANNEFVVTCLVRNGAEYIEEYIQHYTKLGAKKIIFIDNMSDDNTLEKIRKYKNVFLMQCDLSFKQFESDLRLFLVNFVGEGIWNLQVDIDEFFVIPHKMRMSSFLEYCNDAGYNAVVSQLLDMFNSSTVSNQGNLFERFPNFSIENIDIVPYKKYRSLSRKNIVNNKEISFLSGGIRRSISNSDSFFLLTKHSLFKLSEGILPFWGGPHSCFNANLADVSCVLFHFKFTDNFKIRVKKIIEEDMYPNMEEYRDYNNMLENNNINFSLAAEVKTFLGDFSDLINKKFVVKSKKFKKYFGY